MRQQSVTRRVSLYKCYKSSNTLSPYLECPLHCREARLLPPASAACACSYLITVRKREVKRGIDVVSFSLVVQTASAAFKRQSVWVCAPLNQRCLTSIFRVDSIVECEYNDTAVMLDKLCDETRMIHASGAGSRAT